MDLRISQIGKDDAAVIAHLHADSMRATYRGILPDDYLENQVAAERATHWTDALANDEYALVLLATADTGPVGFIAVRDDHDKEYDATIMHLHVVPQMQGRGLGRRLIADATEILAARGAVSICLWVFEGNVAAIRFYERLGGVTDAYGTDKFAGSYAADRRIGWPDIGALVSACTADNAR